MSGLSVGRLTAGVVGARKPQYDVWGSCVNVARSLQRTSLPNCIHVNITSLFSVSLSLLSLSYPSAFPGYLTFLCPRKKHFPAVR